MPVSVCEFTVCVCVFFEAGARVRGHRPSGSGYGPDIGIVNLFLQEKT